MKTSEPKDFKDYLQQQGKSAYTIRSYERSVTDFEQWLSQEQIELDQVRYHDALAYVQHCKKTQNQSSIQKQLISLGHYFKCQSLVNPFDRIKLQGVKRGFLYAILEPHELHQLYQSYEAKDDIRTRNKVILGLIVYQGLNAAEIARLTIKDTDLRAGTIAVAGSRKSEGRRLELERYQVMDLYEYVMQTRVTLLNTTGAETNNLFLNKNLSDVVCKLLAKLSEGRAKPLTVRQLRASVIVKWLRNHNLREVQYRAGHRYIGSTEAYLQNELEGLKEEVEQFHPLT